MNQLDKVAILNSMEADDRFIFELRRFIFPNCDLYNTMKFFWTVYFFNSLIDRGWHNVVCLISPKMASTKNLLVFQIKNRRNANRSTECYFNECIREAHQSITLALGPRHKSQIQLENYQLIWHFRLSAISSNIYVLARDVATVHRIGKLAGFHPHTANRSTCVGIDFDNELKKIWQTLAKHHHISPAACEKNRKSAHPRTRSSERPAHNHSFYYAGSLDRVQILAASKSRCRDSSMERMSFGMAATRTPHTVLSAMTIDS